MSAQDPAQLAANTIRGLAMDAVQKANSGHPGMPMGMADIAAVLWTEHLRYSIEDPAWPGRDRFVLSAGHGSMLLYACLHLAGFPLPMEELQDFRQLGSKTPGHPEVGHTVGVEITTGPLGSGFGSGVGMALAAKMEAARFAAPAYENRVVGIVSDGDLMEGVSQEAASLAGHLGLGNLCYFYDDNSITIDGSTELSFSEDVPARFTALGWRVLALDGHEYAQIRAVLAEALEGDGRPTLVVCKTRIGFGSPNKEGTAGSHGAPLGEDEVRATKEALGIPQESFFVPEEVRELFRARAAHNEGLRQEWLQRTGEPAAEHAAFRARQVPTDLFQQLVEGIEGETGATRALSNKVIQHAARLVPSLVGGSADLDASCKTNIKDAAGVAKGEYAGRNLRFGIREHGMGAILNGMALHGGFLPMGSTFLVFSDYMRPSLRLAAIMDLPVGFIFTHDSLMVGEDGPTHQPVEQVAALRLIPNLQVWRPADGPEVAAAWHALLSRRDGPVAICLTRQGVPALERPAAFDPTQMSRGGYLLQDPADAVATLIATGAEVGTCLAAAAELAAAGQPVRLVSMPSQEVFLAQDESYRAAVLGGLPVYACEMGRPESWCVFTGSLDRVIGCDRFGASGPAADVAEAYGFTPAAIAARLGASLRS